MADNPISRKEIFLAAAAGEYPGKLPDPITREEKYLKAIAENGGGGATDDYTDLINKPQINGVTLSGNVSSSTLGIKISGATLSGETLTFN